MIKRLLSIIIVLVFSSCALGPDYQRLEITLPTDFREDIDKTKSIANLPWWELFGEKELRLLVREAIENNQDINIAVARIEEARALLGFAKADFLPSIDIEGTSFKKELERSEKEGELTEGYTVGTSLFWEIDIWGKIRRSTEAAREELLASEEFYRAVALKLVSDVAINYYLLLDLDNRLEVSKHTLTSRKESTRIINERFKRGYVSQLDLYQAQVEEESAAAATQSFTRGQRVAENALSILVGRMPSEIKKGKAIEEQRALADIPGFFPSELLSRRPDVLAAEALLHAQTARIGIAIAERFPTISIAGFFGVERDDLSKFHYNRDRFWSIGGDVIGPLLNYNRNSSLVDAERARTRQLALDYERTVLIAFREVEDALISVKTFEEEFLARERQVKAGRGAAKLSRARYDAGETNYLEVLDTERSLFRDELAKSEALRERFSSVILLYKALGGGWEIETPSENAS